jgi:hypothetical protein
MIAPEAMQQAPSAETMIALAAAARRQGISVHTAAENAPYPGNARKQPEPCQ